MKKLTIIINILLVSSLSSICYAELHDPTLPQWYTGDVNYGLQGIVVNSVIISPSRRVAVVNGKTVRVGDVMDGAPIVAITHEGVTFNGAKGEFTIHWLRSDIKKPQG